MDKLEVLVVAQQPSSVMMLKPWLEEAGFQVTDAIEGSQGLRVFVTHHPSFVILDVIAQQHDRFEILKQIRELSQVPIMLLSNRGTEVDIVQGLLLGADDYLVKPVSQMELMARVDAILRRTANTPTEEETVYEDDRITIDFDRRSVYVRGDEVHLTVLEYDLLAYLVNNMGQVIPQECLLAEVWGPEYDGCKYVKWHVCRLRRKIERDPDNPKMVVTVRGVGYRYDPPDSVGSGHRYNGISPSYWNSAGRFKAVALS